MKQLKRDDMVSDVWGPHFWFMINTIAYIYPEYPNAVTKRKYYDFIQNLPVFIPNEHISKSFSNLLNKYPVTPYLVNRSSFLKWVHFIHNKVNKKLGKESKPFWEFIDEYEDRYRPRTVRYFESIQISRNVIYAVIILFLVVVAYTFMDRIPN